MTYFQQRRAELLKQARRRSPTATRDRYRGTEYEQARIRRAAQDFAAAAVAAREEGKKR